METGPPLIGGKHHTVQDQFTGSGRGRGPAALFAKFWLADNAEEESVGVDGRRGDGRLEAVDARLTTVLLPNVNPLDRPSFAVLPDAGGKFFLVFSRNLAQ